MKDEDKDYEYENEDECYENENENDDYDYEDEDDETIDQNKVIKEKKWSCRWNNWQIKIIWRPNGIIKKVKKFRWLLLWQRFWR